MPASLIQRMCLDGARADLRANDGRSILSIALANGFADGASLSRRFRADFGETPTSLRARSGRVSIDIVPNHRKHAAPQRAERPGHIMSDLSQKLYVGVITRRRSDYGKLSKGPGGGQGWRPVNRVASATSTTGRDSIKDFQPADAVLMIFKEDVA